MQIMVIAITPHTLLKIIKKMKTDEYVLRTQMVQDCQSIAELKEIINMLGEVEGPHSIYTAETLKERIDMLGVNLSNGTPYTSIEWNWLTRTHGIRGKCMELFYYETV
jgi:hypothetical protein